jgi:hypothetical protein
MSQIRKDKKGKIERDYLASEKKRREELTAKHIDDSYTWEGGF